MSLTRLIWCAAVSENWSTETQSGSSAITFRPATADSLHSNSIQLNFHHIIKSGTIRLLAWGLSTIELSIGSQSTQVSRFEQQLTQCPCRNIYMSRPLEIQEIVLSTASYLRARKPCSTTNIEYTWVTFCTLRSALNRQDTLCRCDHLSSTACNQLNSIKFQSFITYK